MRRNSVDDEPEAIFALLQGRVEILQASGGVVEYPPKVREFVFSGNRDFMLKVARANALEPSTKRASGCVMLRVIPRPKIPAISKVKTAVSGTTRKTRRCTRSILRTVCACSSPASWSTLSISANSLQTGLVL
jgi:hypothetical protein